MSNRTRNNQSNYWNYDFGANHGAEDMHDLRNMHDFYEGGFSKFGEPSLPKDYNFDPKNPPIYGCTEFHPPVQLMVNGKAVEVYGSSCLRPNVKDADIYVSLDRFVDTYDWEQPWMPEEKKHIRFFINDGGVPDNEIQFNLCIDYLVKALDEGKKVHIGCIAGHGRTGIFLAALTQRTIGHKLSNEYTSAIDYVRDSYCANAVENLIQVLFLHSTQDIDVPHKESKRVEEFKTAFYDEIGVEFVEVVKKSNFKTTLPVIRSIQNKISLAANPPRLSPFGRSLTTTGPALTPVETFDNVEFKTLPYQSNLPLEPNGTVAMGTPPTTFKDRLDPEKLNKLQQFKLDKSKRMYKP